ncbi:hypothetical protein ACFVUS_02395 [Nocardia sp. NPDC058058]|uniref:hypothetical protein n=1 Tax=Nocardia sp. NPDC058058 TaxID=3346317 RepID=UPI0036DB6412
MSFDDDHSAESAVSSRKEEAAMNPVFPEQHSNPTGERAQLAGDRLQGKYGDSRQIDRLRVLA